jgi:methyl-accepting chemotaxis protein
MELLIYLGGGAAALLAIGAFVRGVWRLNRRIVVIVDAVQELSPNGGRSIKDTVTRTEQKVDDAASKVDATAARVDDTARELGELKERFDEHLSGGS